MLADRKLKKKILLEQARLGRLRELEEEENERRKFNKPRKDLREVHFV
jgi:hypothetical protein